MAVPEEGERGTAGAGKKGKKDGKSGEKASAKKSPGNTGRSGADVSDEQLEEWARNDAAALSQLIALIPQAHLKPPLFCSASRRALFLQQLEQQ